jgi:hypothetical protein
MRAIEKRERENAAERSNELAFVLGGAMRPAKRTIIIFALFGVVILAVAPAIWGRNLFSIDNCLDRGGRWNNKQRLCGF